MNLIMAFRMTGFTAKWLEQPELRQDEFRPGAHAWRLYRYLLALKSDDQARLVPHREIPPHKPCDSPCVRATGIDHGIHGNVTVVRVDDFSHLVTLAPGQGEQVCPFSDGRHGCTVYRGRSNLGPPCWLLGVSERPRGSAGRIERQAERHGALFYSGVFGLIGLSWRHVATVASVLEWVALPVVGGRLRHRINCIWGEL
jgi:hypothetical protein